MKYDLSKFKPVGVDDKEVDGKICEALGNAVFNGTDDLGIREIARLIYKGKEVDISDNQMEKIKTILTGQITPFVRLQFNEFTEANGKK
jgi:hypothetical protein